MNSKTETMKISENVARGIVLTMFVFAVVPIWLSNIKQPKDIVPLANYVETYPVEVCWDINFNLATTYQATVSQCDSTPLYTADGSYIDTNNYPRWVAVSRDLIWCPLRQELFPKDTHHWRGPWAWGDTVTFYSKKHPQIDGDWVVHDCKPWGDTLEVDFLGYIYPKLGLGKDVKAVECGWKY